MELFIAWLLPIGIGVTLIGGLMSVRGNTSRFNPPSGGGSRIPPEAQIRLNESVQRVSGSHESSEDYYKSSNSFSFNKSGNIILIIGVILIILSYIY